MMTLTNSTKTTPTKVSPKGKTPKELFWGLNVTPIYDYFVTYKPPNKDKPESPLDLLYLSIIANSGDMSSAGARFIQVVLNRLKSHPDYRSLEIGYFVQFRREYWVKYWGHFIETGYLPAYPHESLVGQVRIPNEVIPWLKSEHNINCPKYITFGSVDAYYAPVSDELLDRVILGMIGNQTTGGDSHKAVQQYATDMEALAVAPTSAYIKQLAAQWRKSELVALASAGVGDCKPDLHIIEGWKKACFWAKQNYFTVAISGCENGLQSSDLNHSYKQYQAEFTAWETLNDDEKSELDEDEEPVRWLADDSMLDKDEYLDWLLEDELDDKKRELQLRAVTKRPLVPHLKFLSDLRNEHSRLNLHLTNFKESEIKLVPDLDFGWKRGVVAGWVKLCVAFKQAVDTFRGAAKTECDGIMRELIKIYEPDDGLHPPWRRKLAYNGLTGIDDIKFMGELKPYSLSNYLTKFLEAKNMTTKLQSAIDTKANKAGKLEEGESLKALKADSVKAEQFSVWLSENPQEGMTEICYFAERQQWFAYREDEGIWVNISSESVEKIILNFLYFYHEQMLGEDLVQVNAKDLGLVNFLRVHLMYFEDYLNGEAKNGDKILLADHSVLVCGNKKATPKLTTPNTKDLKELHLTSKVRYAVPALEDMDGATVEEACPNIHHLLSTLASNELEYQQLLAFAYGCIARKAYLQRHLMLVGVGGSGKSTFAELMRQMVGEEDSFTTSLSRLENNNFATTSAVGKHLGILPDENQHLGGCQVLKQITSANVPIVIEHKGKDARQAQVNAMFILIANQVPVGDSFSAISRRFMLINCDKKPSEVRVNLLEDCISELGLFVAILLTKGDKWATETLLSTQNDDNANRQMRTEVDSVYGFLDTCLEEREGQTTIQIGSSHNIGDLTKLYPAYKAYCIGTATRSPVNYWHFLRRVKEVMMCVPKFSSVQVTATGLTGYWGIKVKDNPLLFTV